MSQHSQTHFKNLAANGTKMCKLCLTILSHFRLKTVINLQTAFNIPVSQRSPTKPGGH